LIAHPPPFSAQIFRRRLLAWYRSHARDLPWRGTRDPYQVWVSEVMLQQTQVATVVNYYGRFLEAFPTIAALAAAPERQVLRLWEGLGYYRRARQLHRAAGVLAREHGGQFPREPDAVRRLPGIGRYTAGAILSIAFDARQPILEANTLRLLSRLSAYRGDPRRPEGERHLWSLAADLLPRRASGTFNQALMELGSQVCLPRNPRCEECPAISLCPTYRDGLQALIPLPASKPRIEAVREAAVVVRRRGRVLLMERREGGRWAGLWDFPRFGLPDALRDADEAELGEHFALRVAAITGIAIAPRSKLTTLKHGVTRFRITLDCHLADYVRRSAERPLAAPTLAWVLPDEIEHYPLSVTGRKIARLLAGGDCFGSSHE
jgi:A/G-specific adenine glycosylase